MSVREICAEDANNGAEATNSGSRKGCTLQMVTLNFFITVITDDELRVYKYDPHVKVQLL